VILEYIVHFHVKPTMLTRKNEVHAVLKYLYLEGMTKQENFYDMKETVQ